MNYKVKNSIRLIAHVSVGFQLCKSDYSVDINSTWETTWDSSQR
jgi:hypothetical protein